MNSRGEFLSHHEIIKTSIVSKVEGESLQDVIKNKKIVGNNWEEWQNYFWNKRIENESADIGFDEFLKWATIIHICTSENPQIVKEIKKDETTQRLSEAKENYIHKNRARLSTQLEYLTKYQSAYLTATYLERVFDTIEELFSINSVYIPIDQKWLSNIGNVINYVILLPLIYYMLENVWDDKEDKKRDVERLAMFLKNATNFETVYKNPDTYVISAIEMVKILCDSGQKDVLSFIENEAFKGKFNVLLTDSEIKKIELYKQSNNLREELEKVVWNVDSTILEFLKGDISLFYNSDKLVKEEVDREFIELLQSNYSIFRNLIITLEVNKKYGESTDKLRRALLVFGDYLIDTNGSYNFGNRIDGYSFGFYYNRDNVEWIKIINDNKEVFEKLFNSYRASNFEHINDFIDSSIRDYNESDWRTSFIKDKSLLNFCIYKRILYENKHRIILINRKEVGYKEIQSFLLKKSLEKELGFRVDIYQHNVCVLNVKFDSDGKKLIHCEDRNNYSINIIKDADQWFLHLIYRGENPLNGEFNNFFDRGWINVNGYEGIRFKDRIEKNSVVIYQYDNEISIIDNVVEIKNVVIDRYKEIEKIFQKTE